jgi:hypothetical protein
LGIQKIFGRIRRSYALSTGMVLRTHNLHVERLNFDFVDFDEAMFHDVERPFERIFYIVGIHKSVLDLYA